MLEEIVLEDIREMAKRIVLDEKSIREEFIRHNAELADEAIKKPRKNCRQSKNATKNWHGLSDEDKVKGKIPEDICVDFIEDYSAGQKNDCRGDRSAWKATVRNGNFKAHGRRFYTGHKEVFERPGINSRNVLRTYRPNRNRRFAKHNGKGTRNRYRV